MSSLNSIEKNKLEKLLGMGGGYVLNFSDRTFEAFFADYEVEIGLDKYRMKGTSKANRMRCFWEIEDDKLVGKVISGLIDYIISLELSSEGTILNECRGIALRLGGEKIVPEIDAISIGNEDFEFELLAREIHNYIKQNQPEVGIDRLHTYMVKFVRSICERHDIQVRKDKPLHSIFGEYVKILDAAGIIESEMTKRILKTSISLLESFNEIRNHRSLAHDNLLLSYEESLLVFNNVTFLVRFIRSIEKLNSENVDLNVDAPTPRWPL